MATAAENYFSQFDSVRSKIHVSIETAIKLLREKEYFLINQLGELQDQYASQTTAQDNTATEIALVPSDENTIRVNNRNELTTISFVFNHGFYKQIEEIAKLEISTTQKPVCKRTTPDYTAKISPVISCCKKNETNAPVLGEFKTPWGLAIEPNSGNIYISDRSHYCVQVFNPDCKFLYKFSQEMGGPVGICFLRNRVVICQWGKNYITAHDLNGLLLKKVGRKGTGELEFNSPWGIAASDVTGNVYVCERENNRVQILTESLEFKTLLGEDKLQEPRDVKLTMDEVYILDTRNPCIHVYNQRELTQVKSLISLGIGGLVSNPYFFEIDTDRNLIISDAGNRCITIISNTAVLIHRIGENLEEILTEVMAVAMDTNGMVFSVSGNSKGMLNIF